MDLVYTFVDGDDPAWKRKKELYRKTHYDSSINNNDSSIAARYRSRDELKYSLRSIHQNLPFIRHIYIVTDKQIPPWFVNNATNSVKIVDHTEFIPKEYLPTFSSHVIEAFLHLIPNLSDTFIYMNDDIFISKEVREDDFVKNGKLAVMLDSNYTKKGKPVVTEYAYRSAWKNANRWLDKKFIEEKRYKLEHGPIIIKKDVMFHLWDILNKELTNTVKNKFRSVQDVNVVCSIHPYYCLYKDLAFINDTISSKTLYLSSENTQEQLNSLSENLPSIFCLEDDIHSNIQETNSLITNFLEKIFPIKSPYEM